mgnify:FL=1
MDNVLGRLTKILFGGGAAMAAAEERNAAIGALARKYEHLFPYDHHGDFIAGLCEHGESELALDILIGNLHDWDAPLEPGEIARIIELKRDLGFPEGPWWLQLPVPFIDLEPHLRDPALVNLHALLTALLEARRAENGGEHSG